MMLATHAASACERLPSGSFPFPAPAPAPAAAELPRSRSLQRGGDRGTSVASGAGDDKRVMFAVSGGGGGGGRFSRGTSSDTNDGDFGRADSISAGDRARSLGTGLQGLSAGGVRQSIFGGPAMGTMGRRTSHDDLQKKLRKQKKEAAKAAKIPKVAKKLSEVTAMRAVRHITFKTEDWRLHLDEPQPMRITSFGEKRAAEFVALQAADWATHNHWQLSRVYPKATRLESSNMPDNLACRLWAAAVHMVSFNFQYWDSGMQVNHALFSLTNGGCGYILRAEHRAPAEPAAPAAADGADAAPPRELPPSGGDPVVLQLQLYSCHNLPKSAVERHEAQPWDEFHPLADPRAFQSVPLTSSDVVSTSVEVELIGGRVGAEDPDACDDRWSAFTTVVTDNGLDPRFPEREGFFKAAVHTPEHSFLKLSVYNNREKLMGRGGKRLLGYAMAPVAVLRPGYRTLQLIAPTGNPIEACTIFFRLDLLRLQKPEPAAPVKERHGSGDAWSAVRLSMLSVNAFTRARRKMNKSVCVGGGGPRGLSLLAGEAAAAADEGDGDGEAAAPRAADLAGRPLLTQLGLSALPEAGESQRTETTVRDGADGDDEGAAASSRRSIINSMRGSVLSQQNQRILEEAGEEAGASVGRRSVDSLPRSPITSPTAGGERGFDAAAVAASSPSGPQRGSTKCDI